MKTALLKNTSFAFMFLVTVFAFNSCKDKGNEAEPEPEPVSTAGQFLNLNTGSTWEYTTDGSANTSVVTIIDSSMVAFTKNFKVFHTTYMGATARNYYAFKNGNYYVLIAKTGGYEELVYLKDSAEVGKKWTVPVNTTGTPVAYNYEVKENGLTKIINGTTFTNVVHLKLTIPSSGYSADAYYAPKVGLIKNDEVISSTTYITELKTHTLK